VYGEAERVRIVQEARRRPNLAQDGTTQWTLSTVQKVLRAAPDGFPTISTWTIFHALHEAGWSCQKDGSWCETGQVERKRQGQVVTITDPDLTAKKT
jgi:transposase